MPRFRVSAVVPVELLTEADDIESAEKSAAQHLRSIITAQIGGIPGRQTSHGILESDNKVVSMYRDERHVKQGFWPYIQIIEEVSE